MFIKKTTHNAWRRANGAKRIAKGARCKRFGI